MDELLEQPTQTQLEVQEALENLFTQAASYHARPEVVQAVKLLAYTLKERDLIVKVPTIAMDRKVQLWPRA